MAKDVNIINYISSYGDMIGSTSALGLLLFIFHAPPASLAPFAPSLMDRRLLLLIIFIIWIPSSLALTLRTTLTLDRAVYLTIYKTIRWCVHDLWVEPGV